MLGGVICALYRSPFETAPPGLVPVAEVGELDTAADRAKLLNPVVETVTVGYPLKLLDIIDGLRKALAERDAMFARWLRLYADGAEDSMFAFLARKVESGSWLRDLAALDGAGKETTCDLPHTGRDVTARLASGSDGTTYLYLFPSGAPSGRYAALEMHADGATTTLRSDRTVDGVQVGAVEVDGLYLAAALRELFDFIASSTTKEPTDGK